MIRTLQSKDTWEGHTIINPTATVGGEVGGLRSTGGPRGTSKVVATTDEFCFGGTLELGLVK